MRTAFFLILAALAVSACGGGESNSNNNVESNKNDFQCGNMPEMSCTYSVDKLTLNIILETTSDYKLQPRALFIASGPIHGIYPSQIDNIEIHAQGKIYKPENQYDPLVSFPIIPTGAPVYEFYWYRNGELVAYTSIDQLSSPIHMVSQGEHDGTDTVSVEWVKENNHQYDVKLVFLTCMNESGKTIFIDPLEERYENQNSPFQFSIQDQFSKTISDLQANYSACEVLMNISGNNHSVISSHQPRELVIHSYSNERFSISIL